jgi:sterol 3beta-glucosyltransferase
MKVLILAHGTRGDVQPYAALAVALEQAGHQAVLAAPAASASLVAPYGLQFQPVHDGPNTLLDDPSIRETIETSCRVHAASPPDRRRSSSTARDPSAAASCGASTS